MTESILYSRSGHVGRITLNVPERHNSLGREELEGLQDCLSEVEADTEVRALIVTGAGEKPHQRLGRRQNKGDGGRFRGPPTEYCRRS